MCKAFSCIVDVGAKVTWKFGVDSHTDLQKMAGFKDHTSDPSLMEFARVEITPDNGSYLKPDNWSLRVDESIQPAWFGVKHKEASFAAHMKWLAKLNKILIHKEIVHPFEITPPAIEKEHIKWLKEWDSVGDSVRASVWDREWASVRASVWDSVRASAWDSVRASVGAYTGGFFIIPVWKGVKHPRGKYPFAPCVQLWEAGLVPSFDGKTWRLHGGKKATILFEITKEELAKR